MTTNRQRAVAVIAAVAITALFGTEAAVAVVPVRTPISIAQDTETDPSTEAEPTPQPTGSPSPTPTPTPTPTPEPTPTPTTTPVPTPTPTPTTRPERDEEESVDEGAGRIAEAPVAVLPAPGRIGGNDRYARAILASRATFPSGAGTVLIANGAASVGPVIAATMASARNAPLLYSATGSISSAVRAELGRLAPAKVVLVGSDADVDGSLVSALKSIAPVERVLLTSRYQGSLLALRQSAPTDRVFVTGSSLLDLAAASAAAAATGGSALSLENARGAVDAATVEALRALTVTKLVIVGGGSAISSAYQASLTAAGFAVTRVDGADDFARSLALVKKVPAPVSRVYAANPAIVWDAATAAAMAGATRQPLVYTPYQCMLTVASDHIKKVGARVVGVGKTNWLRAAAVANTPCSTEKHRLDVSLHLAIDAVAARYPGTYAVSVREMGRVGQTVSVIGGTRLEPASMMKLFAAYAALKRIQDGQASFDTKPLHTTLRDCLRVMIHASDNFCHTDIAHWIGLGNLNNMIRAAGFTSSSYGYVPAGTSVLYGGNRTTTNDLTMFMVKLERGELLQKRYADVLLGYMRTQIFRSRIPSGLPPGIVQESKPGALWIASGLLQADTAVVHGAQTSFAISIIGTDGPDKAALPAIARTVYSHFFGTFGAAKVYPVMQMATKTSAPMRSSPGGPMLGSIPAGAALEVFDANRIWYKVWYAGRLVWVDSSQLRNR
ncbi:serine hydrolase [Microbacterium sp. CFBP9034]|uniref:serine hydrolase n=1 Tax=Microbacterium sp. CFBP9034 TaxID=3096540 RepID=UPI002A6B7244|nr:serine hydrolase [Microbacterium sp. CFBP9034]MDY0910652.1 serine hydrolase [Microbacterium sp. CFBP9034]